MALSLGQFASSMGVIASRQRATEDAMLAQRQRELQIQELNKLNEIRARQGQGAIDAANQPLLQFDQMPGQAFGAPTPPAAPAPAQPQAGLAVPTPAPSTAPPPPPTAAPAPLAPAPAPTPAAAPAKPAGLAVTARPEEVSEITNKLSAAQLRLSQLKGPWYMPTPAANQAEIARIEQEIAQLEKLKQEKVIPALRAEYQRVNPQYRYPEQRAAAQESKAVAAAREKSLNEGYADWMLNDKGQPIRGLRNNNPGNIKTDPNSPWKGSVKNEDGTYASDGGFARFDTPEAGIRAMTINLMSYSDRGINTVRGIANNWSATDRAAYSKFLSEQLGVKPDDVINIKDPAIMQKLVRGIIQMENGKVPYDAQVIETGIALGYNKDAAVVTAGTANAPKLPSAVQQVASAVQTGSPAEVATAASQAVAPPAPATSGTMYGPAALPPNAQNPEIQQLLTIRSKLQQDVKLYSQYGMGDKAWETVAKIQALDLGMYKNQADFGVYEGATTGNFSRAMSVLSTFTLKPHQVMRRPDGNYDLYINGEVAKDGVNLTGPQVEQLVRTRVDSAYRAKLAEIQAKRGEAAFEAELEIRKESSKQYLQGIREANNELIKGNFQAAIKQMELSGFKAINLQDGKALMTNGQGDTYILNSETRTITIGGNTATIGPSADRIAGVRPSGVWSAVNAPKVTER